MMIMWPGIDSAAEVAVQKACRVEQDRRDAGIEDDGPRTEDPAEEDPGRETEDRGCDCPAVLTPPLPPNGNGAEPPVVRLPGASAPEVKPRQPLFAIGDAEARLSIACAMKLGYRFVLGGDGEAAVTNPDGKTYHVHRFECDCPDKVGRGGSYTGRCKHEIWISQVRPCGMCGGFMLLGEFRTAFGETVRRFECEACGNARDADLVRQERRALMEGQPQEEALTPEGRCKQAIAWLDAWGRTRYVWNAVTQSPELASTMVRLLVDAGKDTLAAQIAQRHGTGLKVA